MSRGRSSRQSSTDDFLQNNPTLIEYETDIDVVKNDTGNHVLEVTRDGGAPEQTDVPDPSLFPPEGSIPHLITLESSIEGPNFELDASYQTRFFGERDASVPLSDLGIGVTSGKDVGSLIKAIIANDVDAGDIIKFATASSQETLTLDIDEIPLEGGGFLDHGGTSICIGIEILDGDGQVHVVLVDDEGPSVEQLFDTEVEVEMPADPSRARGYKYSETEIQTLEEIKMFMPEGQTFESVEIGTTGDLQIAVTGIDFTTGYVDGILPG